MATAPVGSAFSASHCLLGGDVMSKASSLRVGVIGTGAFAEACHLPGLLSHPQAAVVGICGRQFSRTKTVADRFGVPFATSDPAELCAHPEVDAITICTPTAFHLEHALLAIEHGKHVFCEKPLACTVGEAESMTAAAKAAGQLHQVAFTFRHLWCHGTCSSGQSRRCGRTLFS